MKALNDAKRELRFLLVYLHGDDHQDTDEFCRYCNINLLNYIMKSCIASLSNCRMLHYCLILQLKCTLKHISNLIPIVILSVFSVRFSNIQNFI